GGELILGTALVVVGVIAFEVGSSQLARQALQRGLAVLLTPFTKRSLPDVPSTPAASAAVRGRKSAAVEEAQIASAWEAESGKKPQPPPQPPSRPRIVARRDERSEPLSIPFPPPAPKTATATPAVEAGLRLAPALAPEMELPSIDLLDRHESERQ